MATTTGLFPVCFEPTRPRPEADRDRRLRLAGLMEKLRGRTLQQKSNIKALRGAIADKWHVPDAVDKQHLQRCLESLQKAMKVISQQSLVERLEMIARQLGLECSSQAGPEQNVLITAEMFHVSIVFDKGGGIKDVKVVHGSDAVSCPELTDVLIRRDFSGFIAHLEGLQHIYQISGDKKLKTKAFFALQSLEKDLNQLAQLQSSISGVGKYIHKSPLGILLPRKGGLPMKLIYFVSPYDLLDKSTKMAHPMTVEAITDNCLGQSVTVCLESCSNNKLQTMPLMTVINKDGKSLPNFVGLSSVNSHIFPASFVLVLPHAVPVAMSTIQKIQSVTSLEIQKGNDPKPLLSLIIDTFSSGKIVNEKQLFVSLPDQQHVYYLNGVNGGSLDQPGMLISKIPFTHPTHVATILNHLRQQFLFNAIISSCIRPYAKRDLASSVVLELTTVSLQQVCITMEHPTHDCMVTVELDISDITNLKCRLLTSSSDHQLCTDDFASRVFQRCLSIPITLRSIIKKGKEQLQKIAEERMAALKQAMWQRQKCQAALAAHPPVLPKAVPVSPVHVYPVNQHDQSNLPHPMNQAPPPPNHPRMMNHHGQPHPMSMHNPMNHQQHPGILGHPLTHQPPMARQRFHSMGAQHMGQLHVDNVSEHVYPMRGASTEMVSPSGDHTPSNPLLATLLDNMEGAPQAQTPMVGAASTEVSESPMLSKLLEENSSISSVPCSGSSAIANASKPPSGPHKRVRKRRSTSDVFSGRSPKHRIGESEGGDRLSTIDMESSCSPFDSYQGNSGMTSNSGLGGSIIDLTEEPFAESSLKKLADSVDSFIQKESRQGSNTESELTALLSDSDPGPPLSMSSRNSSPGSKNENASTSLEELLTGSGVGNEAEDPVFASVDKGSNKSAFLGTRTSPSYVGTSPLSAMASPSPIAFKTSPASLGPRTLTSPLRGKTPPLAAKTPPLGAKTPPLGAKTPPLGAKTPPLVTKTPPLVAKTSPPLGIKRSPSPLYEYASKSQIDMQLHNEVLASNVKDRSNPLYKAILDGPELCDQDSNSSFKEFSKSIEVNSLSGGGRQITGIFEKFEKLENFSRSEQFVEKSEKIEPMSSSILKSDEGKVKLKLSALRNSCGSFSDSFSKNQAKSSNVGTFDFKSDEDEDDPLPSLGSSDRLSVYAASPTRLQISNKPKNVMDTSILRKGEKYKRKESKYASSGDSIKRKRKDESKKERKKKKNDNNKYATISNTVYHSTTVETDQKTITKLKIRVGKDPHVLMEASLSKPKKHFPTVSEKIVLPKQDVEDCDNLTTVKSQSSQKSLRRLSPKESSPLQTHGSSSSGSTVTKTDPKLAKKTTIRLKPLNITNSGSSVTVQTDNKTGTPDKPSASVPSALTVSKTLSEKTVPNTVKNSGDVSSLSSQETGALQAAEIIKVPVSEVSRSSTSPSKRSSSASNSSRDSPSVKSSSSSKQSSESSKHSSSDSAKPPTSLNLSKTSATNLTKSPSTSNSPKVQSSVKTSSTSKNPGTPNSSSKTLSSSSSSSSKTFSPVKNSQTPSLSKSSSSLKSSPSSGSSKISSGSSKPPSSGSHKASSLKFQSSGSPMKSLPSSKLGSGSSRSTSSLKSLSSTGKSQGSSRSQSLITKNSSTSSSSSNVGATISMATFLGAPSARSVASLPPIPKRSSSSSGGGSSSSTGGSSNNSGGATNISGASSASHTVLSGSSSSLGNPSGLNSTGTSQNSADSMNVSTSGTFSSSSGDKTKQAVGGAAAAARSRKGSLSAVIDKLTKSSTASVNVSSMEERAAKGLSSENKSKDRIFSSGDSRNVCGKRSLSECSGDRNQKKKSSKVSGSNSKISRNESVSPLSQYPPPHNKSISSDSMSASPAYPNNVLSKSMGRTSPLTKVSPVNKENPKTNISPKASSISLGKQSQKKNFTVKENSTIVVGHAAASEKSVRTGPNESAVNKTRFVKEDVKRKDRNLVDKVCSNSGSSTLDVSVEHSLSVSNNKKKSGVDKGSIKSNRGSSPLTTKNIQNVNIDRKSPVSKCSSPLVSVTTKFNGETVKDKPKEEKEPFKVPTPTQKALTPEIRDCEDTGNITPKKRVSVKSSKYNSKSPCSDTDSPENGLIIDCPTSPKQVHNNELSPKPDKKESAPVESMEESKPLTWKTVVPISPVHKVRQSPTASPKTKVNSNPGSVANNSPCEIDDDLMDEALIGLGS